MYGRYISRADMIVEKSRSLTYYWKFLSACLRTNGIGLPHYLAGWFRLCNGTKALMFVTDRRNVVLIPTTLGFV